MIYAKYTKLLTMALSTAFALMCGQIAQAESSVELPWPSSFGEIEAKTYDRRGRHVGRATFVQTRLEEGGLLLEATSNIQNSASTRYLAEMKSSGDESSLRLTRQESHSHDEKGRSLGILTIDHSAGVIICEPPTWSGDTQTIQVKLPQVDRVVNVPLHLLFLRLIDKQQKEIAFQIAACRPEPKLYNAVAKIANGFGSNNSLIEVSYRVVLGRWNKLASPFIPVFSVWFDREKKNSWIGHRVPLYTKGPTVLILRNEFKPEDIGIGK